MASLIAKILGFLLEEQSTSDRRKKKHVKSGVAVIVTLLAVWVGARWGELVTLEADIRKQIKDGPQFAREFVAFREITLKVQEDGRKERMIIIQQHAEIMERLSKLEGEIRVVVSLMRKQEAGIVGSSRHLANGGDGSKP